MDANLFQVDSFTDRLFAGNPAGVCVLAEPQSDAWMQSLAAEMNLSETAFLWPDEPGYRLRWFTPKVEVTLCGHATLAAAHILWEQGLEGKGRKLIFRTLSGQLSAAAELDGWIALDFPAQQVAPTSAPAGLLRALGLDKPAFVGRYRNSYLVEAANEVEVRALFPNFDALLQVDMRSVVVTAKASSPPYDFVSRYFAPAVGVPEDPVTGSAHCALVTYWASKLNKPEMLAYQASARGGVLRVRPKGERVCLIGQAVTVFAGWLGMGNTLPTGRTIKG